MSAYGSGTGPEYLDEPERDEREAWWDARRLPQEGDRCVECGSRRASYDHGIGRYRCDGCGLPDPE
jgi:hypothetical protein